MNKTRLWMLAVILVICGMTIVSVSLSSCEKANAQGDLTIISEAGKEYVVHEGEAVVEMVGTVHHGENRGTKPVVLYTV